MGKPDALAAPRRWPISDIQFFAFKNAQTDDRVKADIFSRCQLTILAKLLPGIAKLPEESRLCLLRADIFSGGIFSVDFRFGLCAISAKATVVRDGTVISLPAEEDDDEEDDQAEDDDSEDEDE